MRLRSKRRIDRYQNCACAMLACDEAQHRLDLGEFGWHMRRSTGDARMRAVIQPWSKRAIAAVAAAAVMIAAIIGAYGHASAHGGEQHALHALDHPPGHAHDGTSGSGDDHGACLDSICHGGLAVVAVAVVDIPVRLPVPFARWVSALHGALTLRLDRPPKSTVLT